jgi:hypothetical protein
MGRGIAPSHYFTYEMVDIHTRRAYTVDMENFYKVVAWHSGNFAVVIGERVVGIYPGSDIAMEVCDALNNERNRR